MTSAACSSSPEQRLIAITLGDVAGIGPEVVVKAVAGSERLDEYLPLIVGHPAVVEQAMQLAGLRLSIRSIQNCLESAAGLKEQIAAARAGSAVVCWNPCADDAVLSAPRGQVSSAAGHAAFQYLSAAVQLARSGIVNAIATAPLNKESLHRAGHHFPGHTEILAEQCGISSYAMMLHLPEAAISPWRRMLNPAARSDGSSAGSSAEATSLCGISIAHVTLHTSIASVSALLTVDAIAAKAVLIDGFLKATGCQRRAIGICALNPHGGENGLFGDEEAGIITPAADLARQQGLQVTGPLPVDTLIRRAVLGEFDGIVAMYHDQGHIPVKLIGFDSAINITLGLPIHRTSPTHGTAFDRAWNAATPANPSGMQEAIRMAARLSRQYAPAHTGG